MCFCKKSCIVKMRSFSRRNAALQYTFTEIHSARGRADCIVETDDYVYVFEFKRDKSAA